MSAAVSRRVVPHLPPQLASALMCAVATALMWTSPVAAYRPPARALLERAAARQIERGTRALKVTADVQTYDATGVTKGPALTESTLISAPGSMRKELETLEGTRLEIRVDDKLFARGSGQQGATVRAPVDVLFNQLTTAPPLDDTKSTERVLRELKAAGVNTEVVSYARFDGRVSYLVGSKGWERDKSQMWIDKETLLVTRLVLVSTGSDGKPRRTDVRYLGWGSPVGGNWYPASIEVYVDDRLTRRAVTRSVERNVPVDATAFAMR